MAQLIIVAALLAMTAGTAQADDQTDEEMVSVAAEAGVAPIDLMGAVATTGLPPREYLYAVGELERPKPRLSGQLACIAWHESHNDPNATNRSSKAAGLFQFLWSTWAGTPQGKAGLSPYDPVAATAAAEWMISQGRVREWQVVTMGMC